MTYTLSSTWHFLPFEEAAFALRHELGLFFTQMQERTPISSRSYPFVPQRLLLSFLHDGILGTAHRLTERRILNFLRRAKIIHKALLLLDFPFLLIELLLHNLELLGEKDILRLKLFARNRQLLVLLLHVHEVGAHAPKLLLPLVDLVHIAAGLESALFHQLKKI